MLGQAIKAYIVPTPQTIVNKKEIITYCTENLEPYSVPKYIEILKELPKTAHGKIDKKALKESNKQFQQTQAKMNATK